MNSITLNKLFGGLKDITILSTDVESQEIALAMLLLVHTEMSEFVEVDSYHIPENVYQDAVFEMRNDNKIKSIKILKEGTKRDGERLGIREAKELAERISIIEKIPMVNGFLIPAK